MADLVERGRAAYTRWNNPPSSGLPDDARVVLEMADRLTTLEAEAQENARLLGMGGEREAGLHGEIERLKRMVAALGAEASEGERRGLENVSPVERLNDVPASRILEALEGKSQKAVDTSCLEWTGALATNGYARVYIDGVRYPAHRAAWVALHGPMPLSCMACHVCDNRKCVNPHHIFAGSNATNAIDATLKGRQHFQRSPSTMPCGEKHGSAKLSAQDVLDIRASSETSAALARRYGVDRRTLRDARSGRTWARALIPEAPAREGE